uniref:Uncharacterized protein n=1 Tax=Vespula pensylvanica TaxID=30213 RepID=A0A834PDX5_VESPE|nr:hypothetical protein H0235_000266 [Vespula pensylvanica]
MELPAHATQHGALHLGVGVAVNPGDPAGSTLAAIHPHPQDPLALHHHNHAAATPGEEMKPANTVDRTRAYLFLTPKPHSVVHITDRNVVPGKKVEARASWKAADKSSSRQAHSRRFHYDLER